MRHMGEGDSFRLHGMENGEKLSPRTGLAQEKGGAALWVYAWEKGKSVALPAVKPRELERQGGMRAGLA